jgi:hypothetical protein
MRGFAIIERSLERALLPQQDNLEIAPDAIRNQLAKILRSSVFADS